MVAQTDHPALRDSSLPRLPWWVKAVIVLCCAIQGLTILADFLGYPIVGQALVIFGGFWSPILWAGHGVFPGHVVSVFVTYGFLHAGPEGQRQRAVPVWPHCLLSAAGVAGGAPYPTNTLFEECR